MVLNRQRHTDDRHRGDAGRNEPGGLAGLDDSGAIEGDSIPASIRTNMALNAFKIAINGSLTRFNLQNGVIDDFQDDSGILSGGIVSGGVLISEYVPNYADSYDASSVYSGQVAARAFDGLFNASNQWQANSSTGWLTASFLSPIILSHVNIKGAADQTNYGIYNIDVYGSDTGVFGGEESLIISNAVISDAANKFELISLGNSTAYQYYKFVFDSATVSRIVVQELQMLTDTAGETVVCVSTSAESQPTNIHAVILADDAAIILNTDLKFYASVDDGATWEQITLEDSGDYSATAKILTGSVTVAGTGINIKYKIKCTQADFEFYAVGLLWD